MRVFGARLRLLGPKLLALNRFTTREHLPVLTARRKFNVPYSSPLIARGSSRCVRSDTPRVLSTYTSDFGEEDGSSVVTSERETKQTVIDKSSDGGKQPDSKDCSVEMWRGALSEHYNLEVLLSDIEKQRSSSESTSGTGRRKIKHKVKGEKKRDSEGRELESRTESLLIDELVQLLREENAQDLCVIRVPKELGYVDYFVICTGTSRRHLLRMADTLVHEVSVEAGMGDWDDWQMYTVYVWYVVANT